MHRRLMTELPSRLINRWQVQGGDICVLPVGTTEAVGPHLPLGARTFAAEALAKLLAESADGLLLPPVALSPVFGTQANPGTMDVSETETLTLVRALMDDMLATGFRRIVLVAYLEYACYYLPTEFYEDHNVAAAGVNVTGAVFRGMDRRGIREDSIILGAMRILGRDDLVAKCLAAAERWKAEGRKVTPLSAASQEMLALGHAGMRWPKGYFPVPPADRIDPEAGEAVLREAAAERLPGFEGLRRYNEFLLKRHSRAFKSGGWFRDEEGGVE
jgi:hypothetical protein